MHSCAYMRPGATPSIHAEEEVSRGVVVLPEAGDVRSYAQSMGWPCGSGLVFSPGPGACQVAAIIGSWLPWGVICGGSGSVELACGAFGLTAEPGASLIPVSRGAMGRVWCLDLGAERYAVKELFWESDEESVRREVTFTAHLESAGIRLPGSLPGRGGRFLQELAPVRVVAGCGCTGGLMACPWTWPAQGWPSRSATWLDGCMLLPGRPGVRSTPGMTEFRGLRPGTSSRTLRAGKEPAGGRRWPDTPACYPTWQIW